MCRLGIFIWVLFITVKWQLLSSKLFSDYDRSEHRTLYSLTNLFI